MKVMVLAGGPDRERPVSLRSGQAVAAALEHAGHEVTRCDIGPGDLSALEQFHRWNGHVIFPVLHGPWGEGGALQEILDQRNLPYVGSKSSAARLCMDKHATKRSLVDHGLATPDFEVLSPSQRPRLTTPFVLKPISEGSSFGVMICHDHRQVEPAMGQVLDVYHEVLVEAFIDGKEITVGILDTPEKLQALPPIQVLPSVAFYDYQAKYDRDDTQYLVGEQQIDLPPHMLEAVAQMATRVHRLMGCRHLSRIDFMIDADHRPWILEVNTMPGFTDHSLLPMAAAHAGVPMPRLVGLLVEAAVAPAPNPSQS